MSNEANRTRPSLLLRLRDARDEAAWGQFVEIYTPLIYGFCRKHDLQDADAADVGQEVLRTVARGMERFEYDPGRGKFRNWLLTVTRSKLNNFFTSRQRQPNPASATSLQQLAESQPTAEEQSHWDAEYHRQVFHWAAGRIRGEFQEKSWQAFWQTTVEQRDGKEVAEAVGLSIGAVYVAKSRVLARLKEEIRAVEEEDVPVAGV
jgi:RNA polymerase sigma-70 factor (ECF subfamily)